MLLFPSAILAVQDENDREYLERIYVEHHRLMFWTAYRVLGRRDGVEDVVNDACVKLICKISLLRELDCNKLRSYIVSCVRNAAIDRLRRDGRMRDAWDDDLAETLVDPQEDMLEHMALCEEIEAYAACIRRLPEADQTLLRLRYRDELSEREMAKQTGMKLPALRSRLYRAKLHAQKLWKEARTDE